MSEHSKEPWQLTDIFKSLKTDLLPAYKVRDSHSEEISRLEPYDDMAFDIVNAERIVACINACAGIPNEHLERIVVAGLAHVLLYQRWLDMCNVEELPEWMIEATERRKHD